MAVDREEEQSFVCVFVWLRGGRKGGAGRFITQTKVGSVRASMGGVRVERARGSMQRGACTWWGRGLVAGVRWVRAGLAPSIPAGTARFPAGPGRVGR